ncbi:YHS domain-containing (seleno)protein [Sphingorhabdus sp. Alg239-R122]|uniref:YHS domain-containing (seleno)protein n=1 Tax=Sphingorhabdus sp. Alg239-R122 TaxID=2305989 RepID=UPI0013DB9FA1|nr:YHS domain-containing (seleno)protein [Sphingorhabdus sp. Alg239-R122]
MTKRFTLLSAIALSAMTATPATAADEYNVSSGLTAASAPLALHGVDTVAFIDTGNRIQGSAKYTAVHDGVAYYFSTQANLDSFTAAPGRYMPQNGGFCTFDVSVGKKFDGDPRWADVRDGKLYVFLSEAVFNAYLKDPEGAIAKAERNWKQIRHTAAKDL